MPRYVIRVVYPNGVAWLRHGPVIGTGPIVRFRSKREAEEQLEFVRQGLDADAVASVVEIADAERGNDT
jgi:hypothetical protein